MGSVARRAIAFTLIELLVVIAIISLLVSILIPSLQKAKNLARQVACAANWHNVGLAGGMYESDNHSMPGFEEMGVEIRGYWNYANLPGGFGLFGPYGEPQWLANPWPLPGLKADEHGIYSCTEGTVPDDGDDSNVSSLETLLNINYILPMTCPGAKFSWESGWVEGKNFPALTPEYDTNSAGTAVGVCDMATMFFDFGVPYIPSGHRNAGLNVLYLDGHVVWKNTEEFSNYGITTNMPNYGFSQAFND